ncbi:hypothetical protein ASD51_20635 [Streptomyces sp. Root55]|nr:hypothetical protein ASD26_25555 [Streptomyces sp. Root1319]KQZ03498.1 hypothetical protein ASD51_20635 [Streptomyces sp. Root55]
MHEVGAGVHVPLETFSTLPTFAVPEIAGASVAPGADPVAASTAEASERDTRCGRAPVRRNNPDHPSALSAMPLLAP